MDREEVGVYRGFLVAIEHDQEGWGAKAISASQRTSALACWSHSRDGALDLIRASIDRTVNDWPELTGFQCRLP